jgi:hypothetical protein
VVALLVGLSTLTFARDDGRYANDPLKYWFDNLTSSNGKCCSSLTALRSATLIGTRKTVITALHGEWINVPNSSVVTEPNRYGPIGIGQGNAVSNHPVAFVHAIALRKRE